MDAEINPDDHIGLVYNVAIELANNNSLCRRRLGTDIGEYIGYGFIGLKTAAKNYKSHLGPWSTYAWKVIQDFIIKAARRDTIIRVSDNAQYQAWRSFKGKPKNGPITEKCLTAAKTAITNKVTMLNGQTTLSEVHDPEPDWIKNEIIKHGLRFVNKRQKFVLTHRYGLNGEEPKTLEDIGTLLGITRERVRQIEFYAIQTLREKLI